MRPSASTATPLLVLLSMATVACGGSGGNPAPTSPGGSVSSVLVSPPTLTLDPGGTAKLAADVRDATGTPIASPSVQWSAAPAAVVSVTSEGVVAAVAAGDGIVTATAGGRSGTAAVTVRNTYDIDGRAIPTFITADYIDLSKIAQVSLFRSGVGHDYSDSRESCRSMKHYFMPRANVAWSSVEIATPVAGTILAMQPETTLGTQVQIRPAAFPAFTVIIFHVRPDAGIAAGMTVNAGMRLGYHIGSETMSDIAVRVETPAGTRLVSYFDAMDAATFGRYQTRGAATRQSMIISQAVRDANPLSCAGQTFVSGGALENWFVLN